MKQPKSPEAVRLLLVIQDLQRAHARLHHLGRCPAAQLLIVQAFECARVAYDKEQGDLPT